MNQNTKEKTSFEELDSGYMIRKKFFVPKKEHTRSHKKRGDPNATNFWVEDEPINEDEWH